MWVRLTLYIAGALQLHTVLISTDSILCQTPDLMLTSTFVSVIV